MVQMGGVEGVVLVGGQKHSGGSMQSWIAVLPQAASKLLLIMAGCRSGLDSITYTLVVFGKQRDVDVVR